METNNIKVGDYLIKQSTGILVRVRVERLTKTLAICTRGERIRLKGMYSGSSDWNRTYWTLQTSELLSAMQRQNARSHLITIMNLHIKELSISKMEEIVKIIESK